MQNLFRGKRISILIVLIILLFVIPATILIINTLEPDKETEVLTNKIRQFAKEKTEDSKPPERIEAQLTRLSEKASEKEKYEALSIVGFYFSDAYSSTHDPEIRKFSAEIISPYAKKEFLDFYKDIDFIFTCADSTCGQKLSSEIEHVFALLDESDVENYYVKTIKENLTTAGYIPDSEIEEKKVGFSLVYDQLLRVGDPKASEAAQVLKTYSRQKYNFSI